MVTVSRNHQDVDPVRDGLHDLAFDVSPPVEQYGIRATETSGRRGEQIRRFVSGDHIVWTSLTAPAGAASEESNGCRIRRLGDL